MSSEPLEAVREIVIQGRVSEISRAVQAALDLGLGAEQILQAALLPAMEQVGRRFECEAIYIPEMMASAKAMQASLKVLRPLLAQSGGQPSTRVVLGTVQGDMHDIGKSLVGLMLEGGGFEVLDLGTNVEPARFVQAVREGAAIVGLSALLSTTMINMPAVLRALEAAGVRDRARVIIGGAPVNRAFADQIGADGYAPDDHPGPYTPLTSGITSRPIRSIGSIACTSTRLKMACWNPSPASPRHSSISSAGPLFPAAR
jgi:5-methyltetrahydrofolate--homocysteine methyltransferase